jgi:hypothetical protein
MAPAGGVVGLIGDDGLPYRRGGARVYKSNARAARGRPDGSPRRAGVGARRVDVRGGRAGCGTAIGPDGLPFRRGGGVYGAYVGSGPVNWL